MQQQHEEEEVQQQNGSAGVRDSVNSAERTDEIESLNETYVWGRHQPRISVGGGFRIIPINPDRYF